MQDIKGYITEAEVSYKRITYVIPTKHRYSTKELDGLPDSYKYSCPVCDYLGNEHQVLINEPNCPMCNVNLKWGLNNEKYSD